MKLSDVNQKIIHAVIKKAETVCPGSLALIGVYGSVCTGDIHDKSDLDLMILINDDAGWQLSDGFIIDDNIMKDAKKVYADTMLAETISEVRLYASYCIELLLNAVMIENGKYFHRGVKRTFEELEGLPLPIGFVDNIYSVITASETAGLKRSLTALLRSAVIFTKREKEKEQPSENNIAGTYEEMFSNWRNKMEEAADKKDVFSSFMNLASLHLMIDEIAEDVAIEPFNRMDKYCPGDLESNVAVFDDALNTYLLEYKKIGISSKHFASVEDFLDCYL